jgi:hypothetical protein
MLAGGVLASRTPPSIGGGGTAVPAVEGADPALPALPAFVPAAEAGGMPAAPELPLLPPLPPGGGAIEPAALAPFVLWSSSSPPHPLRARMSATRTAGEKRAGLKPAATKHDSARKRIDERPCPLRD